MTTNPHSFLSVIISCTFMFTWQQTNISLTQLIQNRTCTVIRYTIIIHTHTLYTCIVTGMSLTWPLVTALVCTRDGELHSFFRAPIHTRWGEEAESVPLPPPPLPLVYRHDRRRQDESSLRYTTSWRGDGRQNTMFSTEKCKRKTAHIF